MEREWNGTANPGPDWSVEGVDRDEYDQGEGNGGAYEGAGRESGELGESELQLSGGIGGRDQDARSEASIFLRAGGLLEERRRARVGCRS